MEFHEVLLLLAAGAFLIGALLARWAFVGFLALLGVAYIAAGFISTDGGREAGDFTPETLALFLVIVSGAVVGGGALGTAVGKWRRRPRSTTS